MERSNSGAFLLLIYFLVALYLVPLYPQGDSARELTDWATTASLVEYNTFNTERVTKAAKIDLGDNVVRDKNGAYSKNPPGLAFFAAPFYALTRTLIGAPDEKNVYTSWLVLRLIFSSLPLLLLGIWLYSREVDSYSLAALLFATPLFPFSLLYYPHVFVAVLVYMGFRMIYDPPRLLPETCFSSAFVVSLAATCDVLVLVPLVIFGFGLLFTEKRDRLRRVIFYIAGALPPLAAVGVFNFFVFGSPLYAISHAPVALPSLNAVFVFLFSPSHGILVFAPVLILGLWALLSSNESGTLRHNIKTAAVFLTFIAALGTAESFGGASAGPRHMIIIVPLLLDAFFDGEIEEYPSILRSLVLIISMVFCALPVLSYPFADPGLRFPQNSFWMPLLVSDNAFGMTLAQLFGLPASLWTLLPSIAALSFVAVALWRDSKFPVRFAAGLLAGLAIANIYIFSYSYETEAGAAERRAVRNVLSLTPK